MNKILIALVLVVVSGNVNANFITDLFKSEEEKERSKCMKAIEKGKLIQVHDEHYYPSDNYKSYIYKGELYTFNSSQNKCTKVTYEP